MKPNTLITLMISLAMLAFATASEARWDPAEAEKQRKDAQEAIDALLEQDPEMQRFFDAAAGYVVIPTVGKAGIGIGGARGKGVLFENGDVTAVVTMTQLSIGFQWGGQAYSQYIFFEDQSTLNTFKQGNFELNAQVSAVAVTLGASADASFKNGMAIFTMAKGGLMYEAAVGGQKFKVEAR